MFIRSVVLSCPCMRHPDRTRGGTYLGDAVVSSQPKKLTGTLLAIETAQVLARAWSHPDQMALAQLSPTQTAMGFGVDASLPIPLPLTLDPKPSGSPPRGSPSHSQIWPTGSSPQKPRPTMVEEAAAAVEGQFEAFKAVHLENMLDGHNNQQAVAARLRAFEATKTSIIVQTQAAARWLSHNKGNFPPATSPFASSPLEAACPPISSAGAPPVFPSSGLNTNVPALPSDLGSVPAVLAAWSRPGTPGARSPSPVHVSVRPRSTSHSTLSSPTSLSLATSVLANRDPSPPNAVAPSSLMTPLSAPASSSAETNASTSSATTGLFPGRMSPVLAPSLLTSPPSSLSPVARGITPLDLKLDGNAHQPPSLHLSSPKDGPGTPTGQSTATASASALSVRRSLVPSPTMLFQSQSHTVSVSQSSGSTADSSVSPTGAVAAASSVATKANEPVYFNFERSDDHPQAPPPVASPLDYFNAPTPMASQPFAGGPDLQQVDPQLQFHFQRVSTPVAALRLGAGINDEASNIVSKPLQSRPLSAAPVVVSKPTKGSRPATGNAVTPSNINPSRQSLPEHQAVIGTGALTREDLLDSDSDEEFADGDLAHPRFVPLNALLAMRETIMKHRPLHVIIQRMWQVCWVGKHLTREVWSPFQRVCMSFELCVCVYLPSFSMCVSCIIGP
jgi:hypothetical protein